MIHLIEIPQDWREFQAMVVEHLHRPLMQQWNHDELLEELKGRIISIALASIHIFSMNANEKNEHEHAIKVMQSVTVQISLGTTSHTIDTTYIVVVCMVLFHVGRLRGGIYSTTRQLL